MKIEDEIKQPEFKDEIQKLMINQLFTGKWVSNIMAKQFKPFNLTHQQSNVLRILRGQKGKSISVSMITERMIDRMSNVSRLIDKLKLKQFVDRTLNDKDKRQVDIVITDLGLKLIDEIEKHESELKDKFNSLTIDEAKELNRLLDKLRS